MNKYDEELEEIKEKVKGKVISELAGTEERFCSRIMISFSDGSKLEILSDEPAIVYFYDGL